MGISLVAGKTWYMSEILNSKGDPGAVRVMNLAHS
jgi:hypothetical protein